MSKASKYPLLDSCNPSQCISRKMRRCNQIVSQTFRKHLLPFDLTNSQLSILFICAKVETVSQKQLSDWLVLEKSTVSRNLRRLFEKEYLVKASNQQITITEEGKILLEKVIPEWEKAMKEIRSILEQEGEDALNLILSNLST